MSITFSSTRDAKHIGFHILCYGYGSENNFKSENFISEIDAINAHKTAHSNNSDCDFTINDYAYRSYDTDNDPALNISNNNGIYLLNYLGFEKPEYVGSVDADDMMGRILIAEGLAPHDEGVPDHQISSSGATIIDCGRPAGYLQDKLKALHLVAEFAKKYNAQVSWG